MNLEVGQRVRFRASPLSLVGQPEEERGQVGVIIAMRQMPHAGWRVDIRFSDTDILHGVNAARLELEPSAAPSNDR